MKTDLIQKLSSFGVQLTVVDGNLKVNAPKGALTSDLIEEIKTNKPYLINLISSGSHISKAPIQDNYAVTPSQKRLWALSNFEGGNVAYNMSNVMEFIGVFDQDKFLKAFEILIQRHESLRTYFQQNAHGELRQFVVDFDALEFDINYQDISEESTTRQEQIIQKYNSHAFNLSNAPLLKVDILQVEKDKYILIVNVHHIVSDGWSMEVLSNELVQLYNGLLSDSIPTLVDLPIQYKDYATWLAGDEQIQALKQSEDYWLNKFSGELPVLDLPTVKKRPQIKTYNGSSFEFEFSKELYASLTKFTREQDASLFMGVMAGLNGLFSRYTDKEDIVLGTAIAGRQHPSLEGQIGLYLNTLAVRTQFQKAKGFQALMDVQKTTLIDAYKHQSYPFDALIDQLDVKRDISRSVLFDIMVIFQNQKDIANTGKREFNGMTICPHKTTKTTSQFDMSFSFVEEESALKVVVDYNTDIYDQAFIKRALHHLENFIIQGVQKPVLPIELLDYLSVTEKLELCEEFNGSTVSYNEEMTIVDLFQQQVFVQSDAIAITFGDKKISYKELDERSNQLANYLLMHNDFENEHRIGIQLERSEWLIISMLAALKIGAAYVPLDPSFPADRLTFMIEDSDCKVVITDTMLLDFEHQEMSSELSKIAIRPEDLAYVIYTSGSTGKPKGVMLTHKNAVSFFNNLDTNFGLKNYKVVAASANTVFDISVFEIFGSLCTGRTMVLFSKEEVLSPNLFVERCERSKVEILQLTPSRFNQILDKLLARSLKHLKVMLLGGEAFPKYILENSDVFSHIEVVNAYGPTETTIYSTNCKIHDVNQQGIGKPLDNEEIYILSDKLQLQPTMIVGEMCIAGDGLARGYINRESLTSEKFIEHPFKKGKRLYKTGDLARWLPDGNIEFVGRKDDQVKLNGYRIELGEIEQVLLQNDDITTAVVNVLENSNGEMELFAFIITNKSQDVTTLRSYLLNYLPKYMVPTQYVEIDELPLTTNGKLDKKSLIALSGQVLSSNVEYIAPRNELEEQLVHIWEEVLRKDQIGVEDDFFDLGGHSLKAVTMLSKVNNLFQLNIDFTSIFKLRSVSQLAQLITNILWDKEEKIGERIVEKVRI